MTDQSVSDMAMARFTQAQKEDRRRQILDAALRCFSRDGFHATTTADIVRESGVSQGTLYLYFATKDDVIVALAEDRYEGEAFLSALAEGEEDPAAGLALLIELHGRSLIDPQRADGRRVGVQGWAEALRNPLIRERVIDNISRVRKAMVRLIQRGQANGVFRSDADADALSRTLIATFQGLTLQAAWGETLDVHALAQPIRAMIHGALHSDKASATQPGS